MTRPNPANERIKHDYFTYLAQARGRNASTIDAIAKALLRFEQYNKFKDFKTFRREQAIAFKAHLAQTKRLKTGEPLSLSTRLATLNALKDFFFWLYGQSGYKSKIHTDDIMYFSLTAKEEATAKAIKAPDFPSLEQIRHIVKSMPFSSAIERRNRALIAFIAITGIRDNAVASLSLIHIDTSRNPVLVNQQPDKVRTKFSKAIQTFLTSLDEEFSQIVLDWVHELKTVHLFSANDPLFPKTKMGHDENRNFIPTGLDKVYWANASPIRNIFKQAFLQANLPYYQPHSFRHMLVHWGQKCARRLKSLRHGARI
jgi:integrase/recombinase XerD